MAIHAISGKPGGGKSMYSVKLILEELIHGSRWIVTNVPLLLPALNTYLQENYPKQSIDLFARIRVIDDDMAAKFWTWRPKDDGTWARIEVLTKKDWEEGKRPSYSHIEDRGVAYFIDEIHNFFNARAWMETGRDVLFYLSQHRKLGDTVVWITQAIANVDKQFRSVTQDYTYLRNLKKESMGIFRLPSIFVRKTYGSPATDTSQPMETGTFKLDVAGLGALYDTAAGVGIHGRGADTSEKRGGLPWWVFLVGVPLLLLALAKFIPQLGAQFFTTQTAVQHAIAKTESTNQIAPVYVKSLTNNPTEITYKTAMAPARTLQLLGPTVYFTGFSLVGGNPTAYLSDGSIYRGIAIERVTPMGAQIDGTWFPVMPKNVQQTTNSNF